MIYNGVLLGCGALRLQLHCARTQGLMFCSLWFAALGALWSMRCCVPFIAGTVNDRRRALAVRPRPLAADV